MDEPLDLSDLFVDFRDEGRSQLAELDAALARMERGEPATDEDGARSLLRALHTLKGNAAMLGLRPLQALVHTVEEAFRRGDAPLPETALRAASSALHEAVARAGTEEQATALGALAGVEAALTAALAASPAEAGAMGETAPAEPRTTDLREETVRVPFSRLDALLREVDELGRAVDALGAWEELRRGTLVDAGLRRPLHDRVEVLAGAAAAVRRGAAALRLVRAGRLFSRFPRVAGELARERGRRVRVVLEGEDAELDKTAADALLDPLLHLVRNAVDHGVEPPPERAAAGKPETATLWLRAAQEGDRVRIEVEDDGRGVETAAVLRRAAEQGDPLAEERTEEEAYDLLFAPGFSTRATADEVSGRGVGLDVVRTAVRALRGDVWAEPGAAGGTRFVLRLPLTVATLPVVFFESGGEALAVPALDLEETLRAPSTGWVGPAEAVDVRGEVLPLVRIGRVFGWEDGGERPRYLLVLRRGMRAAALGADRILAEGAATVRALPAELGAPAGVAGTIVDGRGKVVLLLDPAALLELNVDAYRGGRGG